MADASTIPSAWYLDGRILALERETVFARSWHVACRRTQVTRPGQFVTFELAGEPIVVTCGEDLAVRGFFNVCRHHAAAVVTSPEGTTAHLRCPYHGWTYGLDGTLKGTPDFAEVCGFDRGAHGLVPVETADAGAWTFVRLYRKGLRLDEYLGADLRRRLNDLNLERFQWVERRRYTLGCNWKVFVDNYLDGGYHVPHIHPGLDSALDYARYTIENGERFCAQSSPLVSDTVEPGLGAVRQGIRATYIWLHPNFMINVYGDAMDTNLVIPRGVDSTEVVFDFYFTDTSPGARAHQAASIAVSEQIQQEDVAICESVQRGLGSRAYSTGRLSVRREAGMHRFHQLLYDDLTSGLSGP